METITVKLTDKTYDIIIGAGLLGNLGDRVKTLLPNPRACVISDETVFGLYGERAVRSLSAAGYAVSQCVVGPGDRSKSLATAERIYDVLYEAELDRGSPLIALGGGVIGDLTGFAAGTWLRGVPFVQVPTTLEADIDASVGGKTAVNHPRGKNLIGVFHQPRLVLMDIDTLRSLSPRDVRAGLAESIKHGVIRDAEFFALHEQDTERIVNLDPAIIECLLARNCRIKVDVVTADERETDVRAHLNFGHTVGHAIEVLGGYGTYRHGEAVALGMIAAGYIAVHMKRFRDADFERLEALIANFALPTRAEGLDPARMLAVMRRDKKAKAGKIRFVLPLDIGKVDLFDDVPTELMSEAIRYLDE